ncbi:MAG TPA: hypothetical protein VM030_11850 [Acidimicrobiales bacterium]|nr:hypothetical protein [Acidimicrobiales bacterium]
MSTVPVGVLANLLLRVYTDRELTGSDLYTFGQPVDAADEVDIGVLHVDGHPTDYLGDFRPGADCVALGLVSGGWMAPLDSTVAPSAHHDALRVLQVFVIGRDGGIASQVRLPDGSVRDMGADVVGRVPAALRAALRRSAA